MLGIDFIGIQETVQLLTTGVFGWILYFHAALLGMCVLYGFIRVVRTHVDVAVCLLFVACSPPFGPFVALYLALVIGLCGFAHEAWRRLW